MLAGLFRTFIAISIQELTDARTYERQLKPVGSVEHYADFELKLFVVQVDTLVNSYMSIVQMALYFSCICESGVLSELPTV